MNLVEVDARPDQCKSTSFVFVSAAAWRAGSVWPYFLRFKKWQLESVKRVVTSLWHKGPSIAQSGGLMPESAESYAKAVWSSFGPPVFTGEKDVRPPEG